MTSLAAQLEIMRVRMLAKAEDDARAIRTLGAEIEAYDRSLALAFDMLVASHQARHAHLIEQAAGFARALARYEPSLADQRPDVPPIEERYTPPIRQIAQEARRHG